MNGIDTQLYVAYMLMLLQTVWIFCNAWIYSLNLIKSINFISAFHSASVKQSIM